MVEKLEVPDGLAYSANAGSHHAVCIDLAACGHLSMAGLAEAVCICIAQNQPANPLGLFCHPLDGSETGVVFRFVSEKSLKGRYQE